MPGVKGKTGVYEHRRASEETIEKCRKAYYKWSGRVDPQTILGKDTLLAKGEKETKLEST